MDGYAGAENGLGQGCSTAGAMRACLHSDAGRRIDAEKVLDLEAVAGIIIE